MKNLKILSVLLLLLSAGLAFAAEKGNDQISPTTQKSYQDRSELVRYELQEYVKQLAHMRDRSSKKESFYAQAVDANCTDKLREAIRNWQGSELPGYEACRKALDKRWVAGYKKNQRERWLRSAQCALDAHIECEKLIIPDSK